MMNRKSVAAMWIALGSVAGVASLSIAEDGPATRPAERREGERRMTPSAPMAPDQKPNLERSMKQMNRALRTVVKQIDDASQDASTLAQIDAMAKAAIDCKAAYPKEINDLSGEEKAKEIAAYRERLTTLLKTIITLEEAVAKGDRAAAKEVLGKLKDQRKDGHEEYGVDEEHEH